MEDLTNVDGALVSIYKRVKRPVVTSSGIKKTVSMSKG